MYKVIREDGHLLIEFRADFDYHILKQILFSEVVIPEIGYMHNIWLIGGHNAHLQIDQLEMIVNDLRLLIPRKGDATKTAFVVEEGLTEAIVEILVESIKRQLPIHCRTFRTLEEATKWIVLPLNRVV